MAIYNPITPENQEKWINWLEESVELIDGLQQTGEPSREFLNSKDGDLADIKTMVGTMLATLKQQPVEIQ
jgi:hypothetical protein